MVWLGPAVAARADSQLDARFTNDSVYFLDGNFLRQNEDTVELTQQTRYSSELRLVLKGWVRYDAAMQEQKPWAGARYSQAVRNDEIYDPEAREAYLEYQHEGLSLRLGLQQIDWVDSLAVQTADIMTPVDMRHGGYGDPADVIRPEGALLLGHHLPGGWQAEYVFVPVPVTDREPVGVNGYGYGEYFQSRVGPGRIAVLSQKKPLTSIDNTEGGARFLKTTEAADVTFLAYRGFQKTPSYILTPLTEQTIGVTETYERVNTFGLFLTRAREAYSLRLFALDQPDHAPQQIKVQQPGQTTPRDQVGRAGAGFDYVWSQDLKAYTEAFVTRTDHYGQLGEFGTRRDDQYTFIYRLINETFHDTQLYVEGIVTGPYESYLWSPNVKRTIAGAYTVQAGARYVKSLSDRSELDYLRSTGQYYLTLSYKMHVSEEQ